MLSKDKIDAIRGRCEAATPGPWLQPLDDEQRGIVSAESPKTSLLALDVDNMAIFAREEDATFAACARADVPALLAEVDRLTSERDEARAWVRRLTASDRVLTCVYCGEAYPPGTPDHGADVLTAHVRTCPKHPMRKAEAETERLRRLLDDAIGHIRDPDVTAALRARMGGL